MAERGIITSDIVYILVNGYIDDVSGASKRAGCCKYKICGKTPNTANREICVVVIPDPKKPAMIIVTVMWKD